MIHRKVYLVTGNPNKVNELRPFFPFWEIQPLKLEIDEIQTLDILKICIGKATMAFQQIQSPVLVEDTEFCLNALNNLPGPFIKFFEERLGPGALIELLKGHKNRNGFARTCLVFFDGEQSFWGMGTLKGSVAHFQSPGEGFGFDCCFIPEGEQQPLSILGLDRKIEISHRRLAVQDLLRKIGKN